MARMSWFADHPVLTAGLALIVLVLIGLAILAVRGLALWRATKRSRSLVDPRVATLTASVDQAQRRVDGITRNQDDLLTTLDRVQESTRELSDLASTAGRAVAVLRAPLKYLGR